MKTFWELKEELSHQLNEMEMITHKKKIAAAQANFDKAKATHAKAADVHNDAAKPHKMAYIKAMKAKGHKRDGLFTDPPREGPYHPSYKKYAAHAHYFHLHNDASKGDLKASHTLASGQGGHHELVSKKHHDHAIDLHNNMVDAHKKLEASKKASPLHKAKAAIHKFAKKVGIKEANIDEISDKG
jgi:hypothetical protein